MAALTTVHDDFDDGTIDPALWPATYNGPTETGGRAHVPCNTAAYAAYATAPAYTLRNASVHCRVHPPASAGAPTQAWAQILITTSTEGLDLVFEINTVPGTLQMASRTGYNDPDLVTIPYDPSAHAWLRITETGGLILWDTSPNGTTWTNRRTLASPAWVDDTDLQLQLLAHRDGGTDDAAEFDSLNTPPGTTLALTTVTCQTTPNAPHTTKRRLLAPPTAQLSPSPPDIAKQLLLTAAQTAAGPVLIGTSKQLALSTAHAASTPGLIGRNKHLALATARATATAHVLASPTAQERDFTIGQPYTSWEAGQPW